MGTPTNNAEGTSKEVFWNTNQTISLAGAAVPLDDLSLAQSSNSTTAGTTFAALAPTATQPVASSTRSVITWAGRETLHIIPFGRNADNNTLRFRVTGWQQKNSIWYPQALCDCTATITSSITGVAGQTPSNSDLFCDTLTVDKGIGVIQSSAADNAGIASVDVPIGPYDLVEIQFIINASATQANGLYNTY